MPRIIRSALVLTVLALIVPLTAQICWAENERGSLEISPIFTFVRLDPDTEIENEFGPSLHVGYNFTKRHGAEISFLSVTGRPDEGPSFPVDLDILRFGYIYNAYRTRRVTFFQAGIGSLVIHPESEPGAPERLEKDDHTYMIYGGGGIRFFFNDRVALRIHGTIDFIDSPEGTGHPDIQGVGGIGLSFLVGGRAEEPEDG